MDRVLLACLNLKTPTSMRKPDLLLVVGGAVQIFISMKITLSNLNILTISSIPMLSTVHLTGGGPHTAMDVMQIVPGKFAQGQTAAPELAPETVVVKSFLTL